ncbi:endo-1,4-beta-xylanase [Bacillus sp. SA1-12]|uniref:endo-1,4-beta-xylanase n=1 Tax=Bacillus sp. SA1-12 TaxID=1455638 RepID=UPI000696C07B|nr:endo-1,4-beta-xylanase [Bacillus sp. SA1-12]
METDIYAKRLIGGDTIIRNSYFRKRYWKLRKNKFFPIIFVLIGIGAIFFFTFISGKDPLKAEAEKNDFLIGSAVRYDPLMKEEDYREKIKEEFNVITIENEMKFSTIHPEPYVYDFTEADAIVEFANENNIKVRGHTLVHRSLPKWLTEGNYSKEEVREILKSHIKTVVTHYRGKVFAWDVVNEAFTEDGEYRDNFWLRKLGPEYIKLAFKWAHEADPDALLFYNDYDNEEVNKKSTAIYEHINNIKSKGVPVHGVGFQMHTTINNEYDFKSTQENMKRLAKSNLQVHITELDIKLQDRTELTFQEKLDKQSGIYGDILSTCLSANNCKALVMWGFTDKHSWIPKQTETDDYPLIFDRNYQPKPSYDVLNDILSSS